MGFANDLRVYIDANSTALAAGTSLFENVVVETTGRAVFVIDTQGQVAQDKFSASLPAFTRPSADVIVRSTVSVGGDGIAASTGVRTLAQNLWGLLYGITNTSVNSHAYLNVSCPVEPRYMGHDDQGRAMFGFTVEGMRTPTTG